MEGFRGQTSSQEGLRVQEPEHYTKNVERQQLAAGQNVPSSWMEADEGQMASPGR
jgi:hypothetical protein